MADYYCENCEFFEDRSTDKLIDGFCKKYNQSLFFYDWWQKCDNCVIETLQAENAALKDRLDKAIELPSVREITVNTNGKPIIIYEAVYLNKYGCVMKNLYYNDKESAEARLAELKGEKNE